MLRYIIEPESISRSNSIEAISWNFHAKPEMYRLIEDLCGIHSDLCDTCIIAQDYFAIKLISIVGSGFIYILFNCYYLYANLFGQNLADIGEEHRIVLVFLVFQLIMISFGIILTCNSSHGISEKVEIISSMTQKDFKTYDILL